ncbi:unnamed protein product [Chrysoparadoxa australica]
MQGVPGYKRFLETAEELQLKARRQETAFVREWEEDVTECLDQEELSLSMRGKLMDINKAGVLVVNYSERLVTLLREVRVLAELGHSIPSDIIRVAAEGEKYYRYGVMLKKVATFYNNMESQIIGCQKPMLLDALLAFEDVVTQPTLTKKAGGIGSVTWANTIECDNYVGRLQHAADTLSLENRKLRRAHSTLSKLVCELLSIDLLRQKDLWKAKWYHDIRGVVAGLQGKYAKDRMGRWVLHWDHQIYKALEAGYQMGLESLNQNLPEIKAELVFSQRTLQFKPPIEDLRSQYYREMKKFVSMPNVFEGLGNSNVYREMPSRNAASLQRVYAKAESLFSRLVELLHSHREWVVLGLVDLEQYVTQHVSTEVDFEANLKSLRARRKGVDKLPDYVKVDCMTVSFGSLKQAVEDQLQALGDALLITLRRNILTQFKEVEAFLEDAMEKLGTRPRAVDEIGKAKRDWKELDGKKESVRSISHKCEGMKRLLLQHAPGNQIDTGEVVSRMANLEGEGCRWDEFEIAMEAFNDMVEEQKEALVGVLEEEVISLNQGIDKFGQRWQALRPSEQSSWAPEDVAKVFASLDDWKQQLDDHKKKVGELQENCKSFGMPQPHFDLLESIEDSIKSTSASWDMYREYSEEMKKLGEQDWISFRSNIYALQDLGTKWGDAVKAKLADDQKADVVTERLTKELENIKKATPCLKYCRGDPFKEEHWSALLQGKLGLERGVRLENLTVAHFIGVLEKLADASLLQFVKHLQARAQGEVTIREALQELVAWSQTADLKLVTSDDGSSGTALIKDWKDLFLDMGDKQSLLASLKESQFFKAFEDQGTMYELKLAALDHHLHTLNQIQRKWVYLEPIFARGALPGEAARFRRVDEDFRDIMMKVEADPKLFSLADEHIYPGIKNTLDTSLDQLERCQKALADFLEEKRTAMPRFYFIGDDDLLEILGQATNPAVIQAHLKKLFQGINTVEFDENQTAITAMLSSAGERVELEAPVRITDRVEEWLESLNLEMKSTLAELLMSCLRGEPDLSQYPGQVLCIAEMIKFTDSVEAALSRGNVGSLMKPLKAMLEQYTSCDLSSQALMQLKIKSLVLDLVHNMDVVEQLQRAGANSVNDWAWQKQLRYYAEGNKCKIRMNRATFDYTYEYQGNAAKLVHTPLTDKCYLTLTQGMHMGFGGNPYGPAGTGKTESVKALGQAFGRQVLVFNCDEGIDFQSMGRIFIGLVKCGAWGCFDEFNRLKEDQLSAVSQQIQVIQDAIKSRDASVSLLGRNMEVDFNAGIFVTLNPAGKHYGGRSRLPDNLKALFRPVAMGRPDNELIAEVILYSEGFGAAKDLASKVVSLFQLSKQLLSQQQHYDWGLRALKAVLNTGGKLIQKAKQAGDEGAERELLIKAVRVNTLSKLTYTDTRLFLSLIGDVFPGAKSSDISGGELEDAIRRVMTEQFKLEANDTQVLKMLQLQESLAQRMGCVIVGPSGCGKSTVRNILRAALVECGQPVTTHVMNPKSMPRQRLLGHMDIDTREWFDGVLTDAARKVVKESPEVHSWIICDGDVDPEWIESLNSVLDDNHLLTLPNGERINFGNNVNFIFETHDLRFASPATVSRMGMIFLSDEDVEVKRLINRWLGDQAEELRAGLSGWLDDMFYRGLEYIGGCELVVDTTLVGTVLNGLSQVAGACDKGEFVCGLIRGLGGNLSLPDRTSFAKEVFQWAGDRPPDISAPLDCFYDRGYMSFVTERTCAGSLDDTVVGPSNVVQTAVSVQRTLALLEPWIRASEPFVLVGPEGCGKNMMIRHALATYGKKITITTLHCNAQTTAEHVIAKIAQTCSLFSGPEGRVYRPRDCERLVLYLKDINLPKPDKYDTCMLIAFLQQLMTFGGFYDEGLEFLRLERIQLVASMNAATTVGRHPLSTRFTATVRVGIVGYPDANELTTVYECFLEKAFSDGISSQWLKSSEREKLARTMVDIYTQVKAKFTVDDQRHYLFTPRDLTAWVSGLLRYDLANEEVLDCVAYEGQRLFRDRLVSTENEGRFDSLLSNTLRSLWHYTWNPKGVLYSTLGGGVRQTKGDDEAKDGEAEEHVLIRLGESDLAEAVKQGLVYYEREEKELNMLLFDEVLAQVAKVDRVISKPGGHLLLVGRSGVGRKQAATLAAYMQGYLFQTPAITRDYGLAQFNADLKVALQSAGVNGQPTLLYVEDHQITTPAVLETLNSLLSAGEVPGLYTSEELDPLLSPLKEKMMDEGHHRTVQEFFVARVQRYLHIALAMDPTNPQFVMQCESNPALYTCCSCLWFGQWGRSGMRQIPYLLEGVQDLLQGKVKNLTSPINGHMHTHHSTSCPSRAQTINAQLLSNRNPSRKSGDEKEGSFSQNADTLVEV